MTSNTLKTTGLLMALFGIASISEAQRPGGDRPSREEIMQKYDTDGDGQLNDEERAAMREEMQKKREEGGQDGQQRERLSPEELVKKYDEDKSGELSATELEKLLKDQREAMRRRGGRGGEDGQRQRQGQE